MTGRDPLAAPLTLPCGTVLHNRLAKAAMSESLGGRSNGPTPRLDRLYAAWAAGGAALVITGNVMVDHRYLGEPRNVALDDERHLAALTTWADAGSAHGTQLWMQLNHPGRQTPRHLTRQPVAPSAVRSQAGGRAFATPRPLTDVEVHEIVARFAATAALASRAGFGGVQVHGAHGYLVSQFLSPHTNLRTDAWGGSASARMRFPIAVVRAIRERVGPRFPIGFKLNSADFQRGGFTQEESLEVASALGDAGVSLLEISGGTYERPAMVGQAAHQRDSTRRREGYFLDYAERARAATAIPLMLTGGFRTGAAMREAVAGGAVDVVGLGRPLTVEPDLPARLLAGTAESSRVRPIAVGRRSLDGITEIAWHTHQLHRLAEGRQPALGRSARRALVQAVWENGFDALRRVRG